MVDTPPIQNNYAFIILEDGVAALNDEINVSDFSQESPVSGAINEAIRKGLEDSMNKKQDE